MPEDSAKGHFNVLRGYIQPLHVAGVKIVGDYVDNYKHGLPSEMAVMNLFDPETGMVKAILDATAITDMRTGAVTALGREIHGPQEFPHSRPCGFARHLILECASAGLSVPL